MSAAELMFENPYVKFINDFMSIIETWQFHLDMRDDLLNAIVQRITPKQQHLLVELLKVLNITYRRALESYLLEEFDGIQSGIETVFTTEPERLKIFEHDTFVKNFLRMLNMFEYLLCMKTHIVVMIDNKIENDKDKEEALLDFLIDFGLQFDVIVKSLVDEKVHSDDDTCSELSAIYNAVENEEASWGESPRYSPRYSPITTEESLHAFAKYKIDSAPIKYYSESSDDPEFTSRSSSPSLSV